MHITILASKEIFSPSNKIHREVGRAKDLSAPLYYFYSCKCKGITATGNKNETTLNLYSKSDCKKKSHSRDINSSPAAQEFSPLS
jgi:hypothetical protein